MAARILYSSIRLFSLFVSYDNYRVHCRTILSFFILLRDKIVESCKATIKRISANYSESRSNLMILRCFFPFNGSVSNLYATPYNRIYDKIDDKILQKLIKMKLSFINRGIALFQDYENIFSIRYSITVRREAIQRHLKSVGKS